MILDVKEEHTWYLHITGQVQGVGFRPTTYRIAQHFDVVGQISNEVDGFHLVFNASRLKAKKLKQAICHDSLPPLARITAIHFKEVPKQEFDTLEIIDGTHNAKPSLVLTPDIALCDACHMELSDKQNRRKGYPFNSCSQCGPRYSIIESLPYDRVNTRMQPFSMCSTCSKEYDDPADRRYYAQTISCPNCAIDLALYKSNSKMISTNQAEIIDQVPLLWDAGSIIAIKGIGGYLLTCDANNSEAIKLLRKRKHRPTKPLALMYPDLASMESYRISKVAPSLLSGPVSPIVLLPKNENSTIASGICDHQDHVGVMLPYAPIFKVLLDKFKGPIVATSGNLSNSPIIYRDENAFQDLSEITDYILTNNRDILIPQDDSVVYFSEVHQQQIVLRRSRGMAPTYINPELTWTIAPALAMGAQLKSTFALHKYPNTFISQYLGDLNSYESIVSYERSLAHLTELLKIEPSAILADRHPDYASTLFGHRLAKQLNIPIHLVPHHQAHFCAILGEHNLLDSSDPILGVIWDGTGLGDDDAIWGSEFFVYRDLEMSRCCHLSYFNFILGDKMAKEPRVSALALAHEIRQADIILQKKFTRVEWPIFIQKLKNDDQVETSSMGRLFDAVASILDLNDKQSFEGEAAMHLERLARSFYQKNGLQLEYYEDVYKNRVDYKLSGRKLIKYIFEDLLNGIDSSCIAAKFHGTLIHWIGEISTLKQCKKIAFSGGVFQNGLLVDLAIHHLSQEHELFFHRELSPNDENISFGQLIYHQIAAKRGRID